MAGMTPASLADCNRSLLTALGVIQQQARQYEHCLATGDVPGLVLASVHLRNATAFVCQEAIDIEAAHARIAAAGEGIRKELAR